MIKDLTLRHGTRYQVETEDGLGPVTVLEQDLVVDLVTSMPGGYRIYRTETGLDLYVKPEDDAPAPAEEV